MRSRIIALCTLMGAVTLGACSGKVAGVPGDGSDDPAAPSGTSTGRVPIPGIDPAAPTGSPPSTSPGNPGGRCFSADIGTICRDAPDKAKAQAYAICQGAGAELEGIFGDSSGRCTITCCEASDLPLPVPPNDPGEPPKPDPGYPGYPPVPTSVPTTIPPTPACSYATFGDGSCIPYGDIGPIAQGACAATGRSVSSVHIGGSCPGGVTSGKVECCGAPTPR